MTQVNTSEEVGIGLCEQCRNVSYWSAASPICIICGNRPTYIIPVTGPGGEVPPSQEAAEEAPSPPGLPTLIGVTCPHCQNSLTLEISDQGVAVVPPVFPADETPGSADAPAAAETSPEPDTVPS